MFLKNVFRRFNSAIINTFLSANQIKATSLPQVKNILVIRQHNQFGDMLASISLFRALKDKYPESKLTLLASPENYYAVHKNPFIDKLFVFEKKKLFQKNYLQQLINVLKGNYDLAVVPVTVAISSTSCILAALSDAKVKLGPKSLNGKYNHLEKLFNIRVNLDWRKYPDAHVSDFILDIIRPIGISTANYSSAVLFDNEDIGYASSFLKQLKTNENQFTIGLHVGAAKPQNRWSLYKYEELINALRKEYNCSIYFTGSNADNEQLEFMKQRINGAGYFLNRSIPELAAVISLSNLFITNDTGVMHVAGTTSTPQISIFGPTNPFNWAPVGANKYFFRKSELIEDARVEDIIAIVKIALAKR